MNKKQSILAAFFMLFAANYSYSAQNQIDLGRYDAMVKAFDIKNKRFTGGFASNNIIFDIETVTKHKDTLATKMLLIKRPYASMLFNIAGVLTFVPAVIGTIGATIGAVSGYSALQSQTYYSVSLSRSYIPIVGKTMPYFGLLTEMYMHVLPVDLGLKTGPISKQTRVSVNETLKKLADERGSATRDLGVFAPLVGTAALVFAGISRYFFNKAASYKNEVSELEKEIALDDAMIAALQTAQ